METPAKSAASALARPPAPTLIKVGLLGDTLVGKTSLMARFVEGTFDETQLPTQGVNFMEKGISLGGQDVTFSIWDIGGHADSEAMLPLVCNDAAALLLVFDLTRPETLDSLREWHRKAFAQQVRYAAPRGLQVRWPARRSHSRPRHVARCEAVCCAIDAPLIFCAPSAPINVDIFRSFSPDSSVSRPPCPSCDSPASRYHLRPTRRRRWSTPAAMLRGRGLPPRRRRRRPSVGLGHMGAACSSSTAACGV